MDEKNPCEAPTRSGLLRTCLYEIGIGCVAVLAIILFKGGWRRFQAAPGSLDFWIECGGLAGLVLAAAVILAIRDYCAGITKIRRREEEELWGRRFDDTGPSEKTNPR